MLKQQTQMQHQVSLSLEAITTLHQTVVNFKPHLAKMIESAGITVAHIIKPNDVIGIINSLNDVS